MASAIRTIGHEDRLSLVDHLDELRTRLIICGVALAVAFGVCLWQNHALLHIINKPLAEQTQKQVAKGDGPLGQAALAQQGGARGRRRHAEDRGRLAQPREQLPPATRAPLAARSPACRPTSRRSRATPEGDKPVTLGVGEPFTTTLSVALLSRWSSRCR